jgi:Leucine-rich repeat (LRR) protein
MKQIIVIMFLFVVGLGAIDFQCEPDEYGFVLVPGPACKALNLNITSRQNITSVNGQENFDGSGYKIVKIVTQVANFIPSGLEKFFPNLEALQIANSKLKIVEKKDFEPFPKAKLFDFVNNEIQFIPGDLFEENLELLSIRFESNPITHIGHNLVTSLKKLERVYLEDTKCMNKNYRPAEIPSVTGDIKARCPEPTEEMLRTPEERYQKYEEKVQKLERIVDALAQQIFILSTQQSDVEPPPATIDIKCKMIEETCKTFDLVVELPGSKIGKVQGKKGTEINSAKQIQIVDQTALSLPTNFAEKFPLVTEIVFDRSNFFHLDNATFSNLTLLTSLTITNNKIRQIPAKTFVDNKKMNFLNLAGNKIQVIDDEAFVGLIFLVELNLSHNLLTRISPAAFSSFSVNYIMQVDVSREFRIFVLSSLSHHFVHR